MEAKKIKRQQETLYNDKMVNTPKADSNPKCACIRQHCWKTCEAKTDEMKGTKNNSKITVGNFTALSKTDRITRQKISKDKEEHNSTINQEDLINIF